MVTVTEVARRSKAARRGVRVGDILVSINGHAIRDVLDYRFYLAEERLTLVLKRGEKTIEKKIRKEVYDVYDLLTDYKMYSKGISLNRVLRRD